LEATDRLGLLYDVLQALSDLKLAISGAVIETTQESVNDAISISEEDGSKIQDIFRLKQIQQSVMDAVQERKWAAD
jgi:UTP:GlnB (protein PII) uridylyltransferase